MGSFDRNSNRGGGRSFGNRSFGGGGRSFGGGYGGGDRNDSRGGDRPKFSATCSNCGKDCEVPFRPTNGKPVYCSDCFEKMRGGRDNPRGDRQDGSRGQSPSYDASKAQLDAIGVKLDRIIKLLEPKEQTPPKFVQVEPATIVVPEVSKEEKASKVKKVAKKVSPKKAE